MRFRTVRGEQPQCSATWRMVLRSRSIYGFPESFDELRRDLRDNGVTRSAQSAHAIGNPMSQRENRGFRLGRFVGGDASMFSIGAGDKDTCRPSSPLIGVLLKSAPPSL